MSENFILRRVRFLLEKKGWSVYKLGQESGLSMSTIYNMFERGTRPEFDTLEQIVRGFDMTMAQFFAEDGFPDLTPRQQALLEHFESLDEERKKRLEAYLEGLMSI